MSKSAEDLQFLKDLQKQMQHESEHDYDMQVSPRFWTVGDYKWIAAYEGSEERWDLYLPSAAEAYDADSFIKKIEKDGLENDWDLGQEALDAINEIGCEVSTLEWVQEYIDEDATIHGMEKVHVIKPDTMFLTKEEAKQHIRLNHYHYTSEAHTYAMTAWRAPKVERLVKILNEFDFNSLEVKSSD